MLVLLLVAAVVGACGGKHSAAELIAASPGKTLAEGTAKVAIAVAVTGGAATSYTADGEFDFRGERGRFNLDLSKLGIKGGGPSEVRFSGDFAFMQLQEKQWLKIDLASLGKSSGINTPTAPLYYLEGVSGPVHKIGTEAVRGEPTTRYTAPVDLDKTARGAPAKLRDDIRQTIRQLGTSDLATEAWIDKSGRLRRLRYSIDLSTLSTRSASAPSGKLTANYEFFGFGVPVKVSDPPAAEVTDLAKLPGPAPAKK